MQNKNTRLSDEADKAKRDFEMVKFAHKEENKKFYKIIEDLQSENKVCFSRLKAKNNVFTLNDLQAMKNALKRKNLDLLIKKNDKKSKNKNEVFKNIGEMMLK